MGLEAEAVMISTVIIGIERMKIRPGSELEVQGERPLVRPGWKWWGRPAGELLYQGSEVGCVGGEDGGWSPPWSPGPPPYWFGYGALGVKQLIGRSARAQISTSNGGGGRRRLLHFFNELQPFLITLCTAHC